MPNQQLNILLAQADCRAGLAVARSLARNGYTPIAAVTDLKSPENYSRYLSRSQRFLIPHPEHNPTEFIQSLKQGALKHQCVAVIPITDAAVSAIYSNQQQWPAGIKIIGASAKATNAVLDKVCNVDIATRLSIPCPQTIHIDCEADITSALKQYSLPWVLKRPNKTISLSDEVNKFTVLIVESESELRHALNRLWAAGVKPQIQQFFYGNMHVLCCFMVKGDLIASHGYTSVRRSKHAGVLRHITEANPQCRVYAERLLREIQWDGVACVQFLINEDNKEICYLETNGRFWASTQGSINAGWDFPAWTIRYFMDGIEPTPSPLQIDSKTCYHTQDLELLLRFLIGGPSPSLSHTPSKFKAILNYFSAFGPATQSDVFSWQDPIPSIIDHFHLIQQIFSVLITKITQRKNNNAQF